MAAINEGSGTKSQSDTTVVRDLNSMATDRPILDENQAMSREQKATTTDFFRSVQRYVWDDPDKPKEEKAFLFKLDMYMLSIACLGYFSKTLDQYTMYSAYVTGMQSSLSMNGSELTHARNVFVAGYVVGQLPAVMLATRVRPSILIPTMEVLWSVFTFCTAVIKTPAHLYAVRFFLGLCEGAYFPVLVYIIGSWYTKGERGKRMAIFSSTASLAGMFSGYLQAGAYDGLDGVLGRASWRWSFIICGVISLPIAVAGYFFYPDFPETTRAFYITKEEAVRAQRRMVADGMKPLGGASSWDGRKIFRIMAQWQFWILPVGCFLLLGSFPLYQPAFSLWLKSTNHSVYQVNLWPTAQGAVSIVVQLAAGMISDSPLLRGKRWQVLVAMEAPMIVSCIVLAVWDVPDALKYAAYYLTFTCLGASGIYYAWFSDLIPHDHEMRGFLIALSSVFAAIQTIWWTLAVWRTELAPRFHAAFIGSACLGAAFCVFAVVLSYVEQHDDKKRAAAASAAEGGSRDEESPVSESGNKEIRNQH